jgi:NADPH:quinone reductase
LAVGDGVADRRVGDRVAAFTFGGGFAEVAVASAALTVEVPRAVGLEVAAAAPLMMSAAVLLHEDVVRIRPGESVLMHSAAGGLGSAVPQVGAVVHSGARLGTVGDPVKVPAAVAAGW